MTHSPSVEQKKNRRALNDKEQQLAAVMDISTAGILVLDSSDFTVYVANGRATELFCCSLQELTGKEFHHLVDAEQAGDLRCALENIARGTHEEVVLQQHFNNGTKIDFQGEVVIRALSGEAGLPEGMMVVIEDITEQLQAQDQLNRMQKNYWEIFNSTNDALFVHDAYTGAILEANETVEALYGYRREEVFFMNLQDLSAGEPPYSLNEAIGYIRKAVENGPQTFEWLSKNKDGELFWTETTMIASRIGGEGRVLAVVRDIGDRKEMENRLKYLSAHDSLTGLYNRMHFETEFERTARGRKYPLSIIVADLDGLKVVNDSCGHAAGDELIKSAASLLSHVLRGDDLVARLGGDEFVVLLPETDEQTADMLVERIRRAEGAMQVNNQAERVRFSLGCATAEAQEDVEHLFNRADGRMYKDKAAHKATGIAGKEGAADGKC
ncbi:MAG: diguanylate cyclase [Pelovirga sp.]